LAQLF